ncbi:MAG: adenylate/guanylate cyclase domain-containing protein, partial [Bacteroidetes bacterium]
IFRSIAEGTELELEIEIAPKSVLTSFIANMILARLAFNDVFRMAKEFEAQYKSPTKDATAPFETMYATNTNLLDLRLKGLQQFNLPSAMTELLRSHILKSSDIDVVRMRPFELATRWNLDRFDTLKTFISATKGGILDLHWTVLCPNCRGISSDAMTLAEIKSETHCDTCNIHYHADLASSIEARFTVHPSIRLARHETYCIGGPANMPQIVSQLRVQPSQHHSATLELLPGLVRVRSFQTEGMYPVTVTEVSNNNHIIAHCSNTKLTLDSHDVKNGKVSFEVHNDTNNEVLIIVERESWKDNAATAAIVTSMQEFRDLFPSEAVAPGSELGIASIAVLFTDLRGSTALYRTIGDTKAFEFVQNHFRFLTESVSKHHGGILKTMGDAIMASFPSGNQALQAALEMQTEWKKFCGIYGNYDDIALKIGIHEGSAIAINNKGKLDYFGTTVNIAGRLQKFSRGGDIIMLESLGDNPEVRTFLSRQHNIETFSAELKGLEQQHYQLVRITL